MKQELKLKLDMAKFLQTTLDEMSLKAKGESHSNRAKEFAQFFDNVICIFVLLSFIYKIKFYRLERLVSRPQMKIF